MSRKGIKLPMKRVLGYFTHHSGVGTFTYIHVYHAYMNVVVAVMS